MKQHIVADGESRFTNSPKIEAKLRALRESIQARYSVELSAAGLLRYLIARWRIEAEYRRERRKIVPSAQSLYHSGVSR